MVYIFIMTSLVLKTLGLFVSRRWWFFGFLGGVVFFFFPHCKSSFLLLFMKLCEEESCMKTKEHRDFRLTLLFRHGPMIKPQLVWQE